MATTPRSDVTTKISSVPLVIGLSPRSAVDHELFETFVREAWARQGSPCD